MGYVKYNASLDTIKRKIRRILLNGPPNSRKTSSFRTLPGDVIIQSYPKEKGTASIPLTNFQGKPIMSYAWEDIDVTKPQNWGSILNETWKMTASIVSGGEGPCTAFCGDGLHKLYQIILAAQVGGANFTGESFDAKEYMRSHAKFWEYVDMVYSSKVEYVVLTCWDGLELDRQEDTSQGSKASKHVYPDLPGNAAKKIMGETSMVLYADQDGAGDAARHFWRTRPAGRVWGAALKLPVDLVDKLNIPKEVPQDFYKLDQLIVGQLEREWDKLNKVEVPAA